MSLQEITERIRTAEAEAGRAAGSVKLIAVSKKQPEDRIKAVLDQGHRLFGENRVQEAAGRWPALRDETEGLAVHLIGPLQTNKVKQAMELFEAFHSVDRFIQVNTGEEEQKAGVLPAEVDGFVATCRGMDLPVKGLMCIPPVDEEPALHFALLAKFAERNGLAGLSMGMSGDFEKAIAFGATHVRVGSAIFGERAY